MTVELQRTVEELRSRHGIPRNEGVIDGFGHVSARSAEHGDRYYMVCDNSVEAAVAGNFVELDSESNPVSSASGKPSIERFIHGEIYRARPDVGAIVHTHAPFLIPCCSATPCSRFIICVVSWREGSPFSISLGRTGQPICLSPTVSGGRSSWRALFGQECPRADVSATVVGSSIREAVFMRSTRQ